MFKPTVLSTSTLTLELLPYGLTFHSLRVQDDSSPAQELLVGPETPSDHHFANGRRFTNQTIGRYANRLPGGRTDNGGVVLDLAVGDEGVCLHGGPRGFDTREWQLLEREQSTLFPSSDFMYPPSAPGTSETLYQLDSAPGEEGFPLSIHVEALVTVSEPVLEDEGSLGLLVYVLRACTLSGDETAEAKAGTPINLTVHWGFNLGGLGKGVGDLLGHKLWVNSWNVLGVDTMKLPTGDLICTLPGKPGDALDFYRGAWNEVDSHRLLGDHPPQAGIDHNFVLNGAPLTEPQVVLTAPDSGLSLRFRTNQSTVQIYTPPHCVFLEFQQPLATFLHPSLQRVAGGDTILRPGEVYENVVSVEVVRI